MVQLVATIAVLLGSYGCSDPRQPSSQASAGAAGEGTAARSVEIGVPGGGDDLDFVPLDNGAELRLQTFGQGGTHLIVGVRCTGFGSRAFVSATLRNLRTGVEVIEPPPARPQLLFCADEGPCDLVPYLVHASGLTEVDEDKHGLPVLLTAQVASAAGAKAEASTEIVLSTADL